MEVNKTSRKVGRYLVRTSFNGPWLKICWENSGAGMGFEEPQAVLPESSQWSRDSWKGWSCEGIEAGTKLKQQAANSKEKEVAVRKMPPNIEIIRTELIVLICCQFLKWGVTQKSHQSTQ